MAQLTLPTASSPRPMSPAVSDMSETPYDQPIKSRRRQKIVQGLQRISSSPSLARIGRGRSNSEYRAGGWGSISCVSLASPTASTSLSPPNITSARVSVGYSTAPTSPGSVGGGNGYFTPKPRIRFVESETEAGETCSPPGTIALPSAIQSNTDLTAAEVAVSTTTFPRRHDFNFWADMPHEIRLHILRFLSPKEIVRLSSISKFWLHMCFDGQLWTELDCQDFYQDITANALIKIMLRAGPFVRNLNLRGCVQMRDQWLSLGTRMTKEECRNLESFSIEGCKIERSSIHFFLLRNKGLLHINMPSMHNINNATMKIIASKCPQLQFLNIDWCSEVDTKGLTKVIQSCPNLSDLRASEVKGFDDESFMQALFEHNGLERLILQNCDSLTDAALTIMTNGLDPEIDALTDRTVVPPRRLRHIDISRCHGLTDKGLRSMIYNLPNLEGFRVCQNPALTDDGLGDLLSNLPRLTHLELDELDRLSNSLLTTFAASPGATSLTHLSISYCEHLGDVGLLPILKSCPNLTSLVLDNTRVSDLTLMEAADQIRRRGSTTNSTLPPVRALSIIAFDCQNITWAGVREILSQNTRTFPQRSLITQHHTHKTLSKASTNPATGNQSASPQLTTTITTTTTIPLALHPTHIIHLKAFYGWQQTVEEHYRRCAAAKWGAAQRLEGKWAEWMLASEEAGAAGGGMGWAGRRRRRRRAREAERGVRDDEDAGDEGDDALGGNRRAGRRRARSGGCTVM